MNIFEKAYYFVSIIIDLIRVVGLRDFMCKKLVFEDDDMYMV